MNTGAQTKDESAVTTEQRTATTEAAGAEAAGAAQAAPALPDDALILLPVRNLVLFPGLVLPVTIGREASIAAVQAAFKSERPIGLLLQRDPKVESPTPEQLYSVGSVAQILRYATAKDGAHHLVCQGEMRFRVVEFLPGYPYLVARVQRLPASDEQGTAMEARLHELRERAGEALRLLPETPPQLLQALQGVTRAGPLADMVAALLDVSAAEKQAILELADAATRVDRVLELLSHQLEVMRIASEIGRKTQAKMTERQREFVLREQMRQIQKELGEAESVSAELTELATAIDEAGMPEEVAEHARKELKRLERMPEASSEYSMARTYLDCLIELPWKAPESPAIDIVQARAVLDQDHYGLEKVKRRIIEFLAVRKLAPEGHAPILCFVGPPGVGKTSLGQSIARALGRKFARVALGGVHDEAEIRGHRRTYIGALPGNIIQAIRKAGTRDCVVMLDEIDKLGVGFHGDPSAALLEVLDPEQNHTFRDGYLAVPFDLSKVVFILTANVVDTIPIPLRDRMEIIELPGYTDEEKLEIARRYLVKRQLAANGLRPDDVQIDDQALRSIIRDYTREAGVRNLERHIGSLLRNTAVRAVEGAPLPIRIGAAELGEILGPARFEAEVALRTSVAGVATGLAWTPVGGDILFIEASRTPGSGKLILTGQLGDVMKESVQAALTLVKSRASTLGFDAVELERSDIHVHVPAGAIPKDGPSAGVAMFSALASLLTNRPVRSDTAMTGEISLRGLVLPVGGIKEKVLAALRSGIRTVLLPARNRKDFQDVPESARAGLEFVWLETVDDALGRALVPTSDRAQAA
jgi:ATP-dependent Lon protease